MTRAIYSGYNNFIASATTKTLHTTPGLVRAIIATSSNVTPAGCVLYDNTAGSGNLLIGLQVSSAAPVIIILPYDLPLYFATALTVVTGADVRAFIITEA